MTKQELQTIRRMNAQGKTYIEIADHLGYKVTAVRHQARKMGLKGVWLKGGAHFNSKHAHLREDVLKYFMTHTWAQTRDHFGLTNSELKSLFTVAYRDPEFSHLRKDKRPHHGWNEKDRLFLLRYSGIQPRLWIAKKTKRSKSSYHTVKEELRRLDIGSKYVNGIPLKWFQEMVPGVEPWTVKTKAGPPGGPRGNFHFVLVPWIECWNQTRHRRNVHGTYREAFRAMAQFQKFIFQTEDEKKIKRMIRRMANE